MPSISYFFSIYPYMKVLTMILGNTVATTVLIASLIILVVLAINVIHSFDSLSLMLSPSHLN